MGTQIVSLLESAGGGGGSLPPKVILVPADFPTTIEANADIGRIYIAAANVTDNDPTKTNTGQSFLSGEEFVWDGVSAYAKLGANALWLDDGTDLKTLNPRNINLQNHGLKDTNVTTAVKLGSATDTSFNTIKKNVLGAGNEILLNLTTHEAAANPHSGSAANGVNTDITEIGGLTGANINEIVTVIGAGVTHLQGATALAIANAINAGSGSTPIDLTTQLGAGGVTNFTLPTAITAPSKTSLYYNGNREIYGINYTVSGTTLTWITTPPSFVLGADDGINSFWFIPVITITPPGTLDQERTFYYAQAGNDTNDGRSVEKPVKTLAKAITLAVAESPSPSVSNPVHIERIGTEVNNETVTIPIGVYVHAPTSTIGSTGSITGQANSSFECLNVDFGGNLSFTAPSNIIVKNKDIALARLSAKQSGVTGSGTIYPIVCDTIDINTRGRYSGGSFTADLKQFTRISITASLVGMIAANTQFELYIGVVSAPNQSWYLHWLKPTSIIDTGVLILSGGDSIILQPGEVAFPVIKIGGNGSDNVDVDVGTKFVVETIRYL